MSLKRCASNQNDFTNTHGSLSVEGFTADVRCQLDYVYNKYHPTWVQLIKVDHLQLRDYILTRYGNDLHCSRTPPPTLRTVLYLFVGYLDKRF
jgi:hypothetical protein